MGVLPILALVLTTGVAPQALPPPRDGDIRALYWELRNESEVWLTLEPKSPDGNPAPQAMTLTFTRRFPGKWPDKQPPRFEIRTDAGLLWNPKNELWIAIDGGEKVDFVGKNPFGPTSGEYLDVRGCGDTGCHDRQARTGVTGDRRRARVRVRADCVTTAGGARVFRAGDV